jgi:hypothetical protein
MTAEADPLVHLAQVEVEHPTSDSSATSVWLIGAPDDGPPAGREPSRAIG